MSASDNSEFFNKDDENKSKNHMLIRTGEDGLRRILTRSQTNSSSYMGGDNNPNNELFNTLKDGVANVVKNKINSASESVSNSIIHQYDEYKTKIDDGVKKGIKKGIKKSVEKIVNYATGNSESVESVDKSVESVDKSVESVESVDKSVESVNKSVENKKPLHFITEMKTNTGANSIKEIHRLRKTIQDITRAPPNSSIAESINYYQSDLERNIQKSGAGAIANIFEAKQEISNDAKDDNIKHIAEMNDIKDFDGDGDIDNTDVAISLHPLISKAHRHPNFMQRTIKRKNIKKQNKNKQHNQVNLVQQGIANFVDDVNMFNVNF